MPKKEGSKPKKKCSVPEKEVGAVKHYYTNIGVAVIEITKGPLKEGDTIRVKGATSDFKQKVKSMQIEHKKVETAKKGDSIGLKVAEHAREHDKVFKVNNK